ncbi:MAG: hypothetical protein EHM45_16385 [Desulfobacteraceae bacterium]|nr:MAG: hypothetical protein EHM45_16385 [Desulfobacteraceae bacterium]
MLKKFFTSRFQESSNLAVALLVVLSLAVLLTLLADRYYLRWDLTAAGRHTLSEKTLTVLQNITAPVHIKAFVREGEPEADNAQELLASYRYQCPQIDFELIDPDRRPALAGQYHVKELNTLVLEGFGRQQSIKPINEENITTGLIRLLENEVKHIYWIFGHGERSLAGTELTSCSRLTGKLSLENFAFHELNLMQKDVPNDASLVILAGPVIPLFSEEIAGLRNYLYRGGRLIILLDPLKDGGLKGFLGEQGIVIAADIVIDKLSKAVGGDYLLPVVNQYGPHAITKDFRLACLFAEARSIEKSQENKPDRTLTNLALTSPGSWAETDMDAFKQGKAGLEQNDRIGPISLAVIAEFEFPLNNPQTPAASAGVNKSKLVVFGDADFISNKYLETAGNSDLMTNTINYLVERGRLIIIEKKQAIAKPALLNGKQLLILFFISVILIPLIVLVIGIVVWRKRRPR